MVTVREIVLSEIKELQAISKQTFFETFASTNSEDDMNKYFEENLSTERLTKEVTNTNSQFYFALLDNNIIGYLKLNFGESQTELKDNRSVEIERIYVLKEFHGKNIGQLLYQKALEAAKLSDADYVWLGVWEHNPRAIKFYQKNGFYEFDKHIFRLGNDEQTDIMMKLDLKRNND